MLLVYIFFHIIIANTIADEIDFKLPSIYHIDDYDSCKAQNKLFCQANMVLSPKANDTNEIWTYIQVMSEQRNFFNHSDLFHAICVNDSCPLETLHLNQTLEEVISECYTNRYVNYNLKVTVTKVRCSDNETKFSVRYFDLSLIFFTVIYVIVVISATIKDCISGHVENDKLKGKTEKSWLLPFSLITNWKKLFKTNSELTKLKCIQGIRFYNALLILLCHTYLSYAGGFVSNTEYFENISKSVIRMLIRNSFTFLVSTFFLFSAFCMSHHHFQNMEKSKFNIRTMLLSLLNRYLRIIPPIIVCVACVTSVWVYLRFDGPLKEVYLDKQYNSCQENWWVVFLFINNHYNYEDACLPSTWYLSADFQLYCLSTIILSLIWKFKQYSKHMLILFLSLGIIAQTIVNYTYNLHCNFNFTPENSKVDRLPSFPFNAMYSSTYANLATYMVGLNLGLIYSKFENIQIFTTKFRKFLWYLSFIGMPILAVYITLYEYPRIVTALLAGLVKPLFVTGVAIGVLGMSQGVGGLIRRICEWKFAVWMSNLTYCIYLIQVFVVFIRTTVTKKTLFVSDNNLFLSFLCDTILSIFGGFLLHILVELPMRQIQTDRIPKERKRNDD